jgi:response regulator RpfG family c-di-GMP phosphodiesterase
MSDTILFVDDDVRILSALQRSLHRSYHIEIACGPDDALEALNGDTYAVVVSDLNMPRMNGIEFLTRVKRRTPDTVRILLTGQADFGSAMAAVNDGNVFRFLSKPCTQDVLTKALDAGLEQYHLLSSQKNMLQETLLGTVEVLVELLGAVQPAAFARACHLQHYVREIGRELQSPQTWEYEAAALLSQAGSISLPAELLDRYARGEELSGDEMERFLAHPRVGRQLLERIPRMHVVARIVERQNAPFDSAPAVHTDVFPVALGAQMLRAAIDFDRLTAAGHSSEAALQTMRQQMEVYNPEVLAALDRCKDRHMPPSSRTANEDFSAIASRQLPFRHLTDQVMRALRD